MKEWEKTQKGVLLGKVRVKCLAFADDLAIITVRETETIRAIEELHEIAAKTGLQISYEKTQFMSTQKYSSLHTKYGTIHRTENFKYLGETLQITGRNSVSNEERRTKLEKAYKLTWNHYNKKAISRKAKLRHYETVVLPEALYAAETTIIQGQTRIKQIEKTERKILRKIFGATQKDGVWIKRPAEELYEHTEKITDKIRKRRLQFYGHLSRMAPHRITRQILDWVSTRKNNKWMNEVRNDMEQLNITQETIQNKTLFRNLIRRNKLQETPHNKRTQWTEQRRQEHSQRMKEHWANKKKEKPKRRQDLKWTEERKQKHSTRMREVWAERRKKQQGNGHEV